MIILLPPARRSVARRPLIRASRSFTKDCGTVGVLRGLFNGSSTGNKNERRSYHPYCYQPESLSLCSVIVWKSFPVPPSATCLSLCVYQYFICLFLLREWGMNKRKADVWGIIDYCRVEHFFMCSLASHCMTENTKTLSHCQYYILHTR